MRSSRRTEQRPSAGIVLNELTRAANAGRPPEELLSRGLDLLLRVARLPAGIACLAAHGEDHPTTVVTRGFRPAAGRAIERTLRLTIPVEPLQSSLTRLPMSSSTREALAAQGVRRGVIVPLLSERGPTGALVGFARGDDASRLPRATLVAIMRELGGAVGNAEVRRGLVTANADLLRLLTLVKILAEPRSLEDTLTTVAEAARSFARAVSVDVWLANPVAQQLSQIVLLEPPGSHRLKRRHTFAYGEGLVGWVADTGQPVYVHDALGDPRLPEREWARERGIVSFYGFPLRFMGALVGVLSLGTTTRMASSHLSLLETYSDHAALAIGQADLRRQLELSGPDTEPVSRV